MTDDQMPKMFGTMAFIAVEDDADMAMVKRASLLFEHVVVVAKFGLRETPASGFEVAFVCPERVAAELEWLTERGVIFGPDRQGVQRDLERQPPHSPYWQAWNWSIPNLGHAVLYLPDPLTALEGASLVPYFHAEGVTLFLDGESHPPFAHRHPEFRARKSVSSVLDIAFGEMPEPDDATPWEQIIEWREDAGAMSKLRRLRRWGRQLARGDDRSPREIVDELRYLVDEYQEHMRLHRMKVNLGTARTLLVTGAGVLEDLVKLKWSGAAERLFTLRDRQLQLMEAERAAPGREVAYIVEARRRFGRRE